MTLTLLPRVGAAQSSSVTPVEVKVRKLGDNIQKYAVWLGGSLLAEQVRSRLPAGLLACLLVAARARC